MRIGLPITLAVEPYYMIGENARAIQSDSQIYLPQVGGVPPFDFRFPIRDSMIAKKNLLDILHVWSEGHSIPKLQCIPKQECRLNIGCAHYPKGC